MERKDFTNKYYPLAIEASIGTPIFPETIITAAGLESGWDTSQLSLKYNNFFGFKSSKSWIDSGGKVVSLPTKEIINGQTRTIDALFRVYNSATDSFKDYVRLLQTSRYVNAGVTIAKDSVSQFQALQKAGYATDPNYSSKLKMIYYNIKSFFLKTLL